MAYKITDSCVACGTCIDECPVGAISEGDIYVIEALFRKATSMSSILIPALVAALAPALARTKQSLKTNRKK